MIDENTFTYLFIYLIIISFYFVSEIRLHEDAAEKTYLSCRKVNYSREFVLFFTDWLFK